MDKQTGINRDWAEVFRDFHKYPELGFEEYRTTEQIRRILKEEKIETIETGLQTGVIARVRGERQNSLRNPKRVALRADIDALPIKEETGLSYASANQGKMHACGHDFHTTAALMCASCLNRNRKLFSGEIWFLFQPGEEVFYGAQKLYAAGALPHIDEFYGFHAAPDLSVGQIGIKAGPVMASVDGFQITVSGIGTHAATPEKGRNPIPVLVDLIGEISRFDQKELSGQTPHVISFTHVEGGNTWNVIPKAARCEGTVRTFDEGLRTRIEAVIRQTAEQQMRKSKTEIKLDWVRGSAPVVNDPLLADFASETAKSEGLDNVPFQPFMLGDDFGYYLQKDSRAKGLYIRIGTGKGFPLHHPGFRILPESIPVAASFLSRLISETLI